MVRAIVVVAALFGAASGLVTSPTVAHADLAKGVHDVAERKKVLAANIKPVLPHADLTPEQLARANTAIKNADIELGNADAEIADGQKMLDELATKKAAKLAAAVKK